MTNLTTWEPLLRFLRALPKPRTAAVASRVRSVGRRCRRIGSGGALHGRWISVSIVTMVSGAAMAARQPPLQPMTLDQVMKAGAAGTGCSWSLPADRRMRFAASGDRAAIRLDGRIVALSPGLGAPEMFPFTFAEWKAEGLTIVVRQVGPARWLNPEASTSRATLTIVIRGVARRIEGRMSCGS